jgi:hypothetical protein
MGRAMLEPRQRNLRAPALDQNKIQPFLDDALATLKERERRGIVIRFFANQNFRTVGEQLGLSENAAQKLVSRALDQLNTALAKRGITSSAAALAQRRSWDVYPITAAAPKIRQNLRKKSRRRSAFGAGTLKPTNWMEKKPNQALRRSRRSSSSRRKLIYRTPAQK